MLVRRMGRSSSKASDRQARDDTNNFLKKAAPKIVITASSDDSPDLPDIVDHAKPLSKEASRKKDAKDVVQSAPPEGDVIVSERQAHKNWLLALFLLMVYIGLVVMTGQLTRIAFSKNVFKYKAPFLFVWCKVTLRVLAFPSVLLITILIRACRRQPVAVQTIWRHCTKTLRNHQGKITLWLILRKYFPMSISMLLMQIGWVVGMVYAPTSIVAALCSGAVAFSYVLSWLVLKNKMLLVKGIFVVVAFAGIGLIAYATSATPQCAPPANATVQSNMTGNADVTLPSTPAGEMSEAATTVYSVERCAATSQMYLGVLFGICAAVFYSLHQLAFKLAYPVADLVQVSFIMSCMSLMISIMYFPVPLSMHLTGFEEWKWHEMPLGISVAAWCGSYVSSISYAYGLALSTPFFMSVSEVLIVALNTGIDTVVHAEPMGLLQILGTGLVVLAFLFMVMPDGWLSVKLRNEPRQSVDGAAELQALRPLPEKD
ncbi:uncharacterized protein LOC129594080 [Paramacrobiotus metropolitanus]|uniref:uncharacterized protein LOC129594080 n=1 Tax=Paramacrobiotus metropolitanus TaxID=2943436 RepID=UPI002445881E|nr:uncharacterized protein LOC129594080 [Paramacrobiotus metropolitanus]XP_055346615.1 uncharacterized protein LOC129594080 [Paramacrobiotus metropolitanus]XP_055346616.1 uncharacterized protein LOC129594080 [Paramacrobiotus metropolitanus]